MCLRSLPSGENLPHHASNAAPLFGIHHVSHTSAYFGWHVGFYGAMNVYCTQTRVVVAVVILLRIVQLPCNVVSRKVATLPQTRSQLDPTKLQSSKFASKFRPKLESLTLRASSVESSPLAFFLAIGLLGFTFGILEAIKGL